MIALYVFIIWQYNMLKQTSSIQH